MTSLQKRERAQLHQIRKVGFGEILRAARLDKDIGTRLLAAMIGVSVCTIRQIEAGRQECSLELLQKLCTAIDQA